MFILDPASWMSSSPSLDGFQEQPDIHLEPLGGLEAVTRVYINEQTDFDINIKKDCVTFSGQDSYFLDEYQYLSRRVHDGPKD